MDGYPSGNELFNYKKALIFSVKCVLCSLSMFSLIKQAGVSRLEMEEQMVNRIRLKGKKNAVLVSQVYSICGYQRQCPRT